MPYDVGWYIEGRVIHDRLSGTVSIEDAEGTGQIIVEYLNEGTRPVHLIVDMTTASGFAPTVNVRRIHDIVTRQMRSESLGWTLLVSENKLARFLASTVSQLARISMQTFSTLDDAVAFLREYDPTLTGYFPGDDDDNTAEVEPLSPDTDAPDSTL